jgi:hypothetical protein
MKAELLDQNHPAFDNWKERKRNEAKAQALCEKLGVKKTKSRKLFDLLPTDLARGRALDERVRQKLGL